MPMPRKEYKIGQKIHHWTVEGEAEPYSWGGRRILCRCVCGTVKPVSRSDLTSGQSTNCGCLSDRSSHRITDGFAYHPLRWIWKNMLDRCNNPARSDYHRYGGRGITVCSRWESFESFCDDMGVKPKGFTLERIDNNKGYNPTNCKWASRKEQSNNRRSNHLLTYNESQYTLSQLSLITGIKQGTIYARVKMGWTTEDIVNKPIDCRRRRKDAQL